MESSETLYSEDCYGNKIDLGKILVISSEPLAPCLFHLK